MRGTWQTTSSGPDWGPAVTAVVAAVLMFGAMSWLAARAWWILGGLAVLFVLACVAAVFAWRAVRRMRTADLAQIAAIRARAEVQPQVSRGTRQPAIETHYHVHHHYAEAPEAVRVIRQAVTNTQLPPAGQDQRPA